MAGPATLAMLDLMRIAALSGARLGAIVDLRVKDCANWLFTSKPQKMERGPRRDRAVRGAAAGDPLFSEWPAPKEGRRRGLVNFHSFRRWFIITAEQAEPA